MKNSYHRLDIISILSCHILLERGWWPGWGVTHSHGILYTYMVLHLKAFDFTLILRNRYLQCFQFYVYKLEQHKKVVCIIEFINIDLIRYMTTVCQYDNWFDYNCHEISYLYTVYLYIYCLYVAFHTFTAFSSVWTQWYCE